MATKQHATEILLASGNGNREALNELVPLVYDELRAIARRRLRKERADHTLDTVALVNEAYLKLFQLDRIQWKSRAHFLAIAARAMRHILVDHARRRKRARRGGGAAHVPLELAGDLPVVQADRIVALDEALGRLAAVNPRHAQVVECRFFGAMTIEETAAALDISPATAKRDWNLLRSWLGRELADGS
jgi:RNA polymerase sigma factor (TIGR02999 family)